MKIPIRFDSDDVISVRDIKGICRVDMVESQYSDEFRECVELYYVEHGTYRIMIDDTQTILSEGSLFLCPPGSSCVGKIECITCGTIAIIGLDIDYGQLRPRYNHPVQLSMRQREQLGVLINKGLALMERQVSGCRAEKPEDNMDLVDKLRCKVSLESILLDMSNAVEKEVAKTTRSRSGHNYHREMEQLTNYLFENIDKKISLRQMAETLHVSESTLRRLVYKCEGCAPVAYFHNLKIQKAQSLLQTPAVSVTEIAIELGFSSVQYFSRVFKAKTGYAPIEYRRIWGIQIK